MQEYVLGFMFDEELEYVAVIEKTKPLWQKGLLNGIGGKIENGELPIDAMVREFTEETGVETTSDIWSLKVIMDNDDFKVYTFCSCSDVVKNVDTIEEEKVHYLKLDSFPYSRALPNLSWLIPVMLEQRQYNVTII